MADYDFFDLTGVEFDPPAKKAIVINLAVESTKTKFNVNADEANKKAENDAIIKFLDECRQLYVDGLGTSNEFKQAASEKRKKVESVIRRLAVLKYKALNPSNISDIKVSISEGTVREIAEKKGLALATVRQVYEEVGFVVEKAIEASDFKQKLPKFTSESNFKIIQERIGSLRTLEKFRDPIFIGRERVFDLYGFAAYLSSDIDAVEKYRGDSTKSLCEMMRTIKTRYPGTTGNDIISLYNGLASMAEKHVFKDDVSRSSYDLYVRYNSDELVQIYTELKSLPPDILRDSDVANDYIDKIARYFTDQEMATAIYNKESGLLAGDPYLPEKRTFYLICPSCGGQNKFSNKVEARRSGECQYCHEKLFKKCSNCGKEVLRNIVKCECGFIFPDDALFARQITWAESALKQGNLEDAREHLTRAKAANPHERTKTQALERKLEEEEKKVAEPLEKIEKLIAGKQYETAEKNVREIEQRFPKINLVNQKTEITMVLSVCKKQFDSIGTKSLSEKIITCLEILDNCDDFSLAHDFLRNNPPAAVAKIEAVYNDQNKKVILNWTKSNESGVSYMIVRKEGKMPSIAPNDGIILESNITSNYYTDEKTIAGTQYFYSVFVTRKNGLSNPTSVSVLTLSGVSNLNFWQKQESIVVSWKLPANSSGATVTYSVEGKEYILTDNVVESVELSNIIYGVSYVIYVQANYQGLGKSPKKSVSVTPTPIVNSFRIFASQIKNGTCSISWSITSSGIDLQVVVNGKVVQTTRSEMKFCAMKFSSNGYYKIQVRAFSGGKWLDSDNTILINTYEPVLIDEEASKIVEKTNSGAKRSRNMVELAIKLEEPLPQNVIGFYCFVRTKEAGTSSAPWVSEADISGSSNRTNFRATEIIKAIMARDEDAYYVTLFSIYDFNGKEIISAPCKRKFIRPLSAIVYWEVNKSIFETKLTISIEANRPLYHLPEMIICASPFGRQLLSDKDSSAVELIRIPEKFLDVPKKVVTDSYTINVPVKKNEKVFMFIKNAVKSEEFSARWASGFKGKV